MNDFHDDVDSSTPETRATSAGAPATTSELIRTLRGKVDACLADLTRGVASGQPFALLDFPDHDNVGDSAIYAGELAYFAKLGRRPSYVSTKEPYSYNAEALESIVKDGPVFLHGGGNFGDVWPWFQPFRESVLERFRGRSIIQLPQTIHYSSQARLDETARVIERHGAFTLLVRDTRSFEVAKRAFQCDVRLSPDMAFHIDTVPKVVPRRELLLHFRTDKEAARKADVAGLRDDANVLEADWPSETPDWVDRFDRSRMPWLAFAYLTRGRAAVREARFHGRAQARLDRGFQLLGSGKTVITDRLHGHIMSTLLGVPHCVLDNSYGKTSNYMKTWGTEVAHVHAADSVAQAVQILSDREGLALQTPKR